MLHCQELKDAIQKHTICKAKKEIVTINVNRKQDNMHFVHTLSSHIFLVNLFIYKNIYVM